MGFVGLEQGWRKPKFIVGLVTCSRGYLGGSIYIWSWLVVGFIGSIWRTLTCKEIFYINKFILRKKKSKTQKILFQQKYHFFLINSSNHSSSSYISLSSSISPIRSIGSYFIESFWRLDLSSSPSSKTSSKRFLSTFFESRCFVEFDQLSGGGITQSIVSLNTLSNKGMMTFSKTRPSVSRHGFVLISISQGLNSSSIMKSNPKSSNVGRP